MTAQNGTSSAHEKRLITRPSRMRLVWSLNWATRAARDLAGLGGGMKRQRNVNADAQMAIMTGPHHTHSRWAVRFMLGIGRPPRSRRIVLSHLFVSECMLGGQPSRPPDH